MAAPSLLFLFSRPAWAAPGKCEVFALFDPLCEAGKTAAGAAGKAVTAPFRYAASSAVEMVTSWVADSATWLLGKVISFIDHSTSPTLDAAWFTDRYSFMIGLAALVLLPMLLIATIRAVMNQDFGQLARSFFLYLPIAILGTFVAVYLAQSLLAITDALSAAAGESIAGDTSRIFDSVGKTLSESVGMASPGAPSFAIFFGALLLIVGSFFVWLELLVRSAAVTVSVFFLPLILAGLVWPATIRWTRRLIELLVALILSKFVIVAVISLATAALADPRGGGFGTVMGGAALMLMAAFSPFVLLKLMPMAEGAAMSHLEGLGRRPLQATAPGGGANHAVSIMRAKMSAGSSQGLAIAGATAGAAGSSRAASSLATQSARRPNSRETDAKGAASKEAPSKHNKSGRASGRRATPASRPTAKAKKPKE
jgi:type IV secretion system protein TrbL